MGRGRPYSLLLGPCNATLPLINGQSSVISLFDFRLATFDFRECEFHVSIDRRSVVIGRWQTGRSRVWPPSLPPPIPIPIRNRTWRYYAFRTPKSEQLVPSVLGSSRFGLRQFGCFDFCEGFGKLKSDCLEHQHC